MPRRSEPVGHLARDLRGELERAHAELAARMSRLGLLAAEGWRVREEVSTGMTGTVISLRPIHVTEDAPDIEVTVQVGQDGRAIDA